jgi:cytochrome c oxidase subunit 3
MTDIKANKDSALVADVAMPHGSHGHGESHEYPYVAHHFGSAEQQFDSGKLGVWLFLVTEILFFAGLFCAYTIYRGQNPEVFYWAHFFLDTKMGALNTIVLILSSFTAAWAVRNAQLGETKLLRINIVVTILCACTFMCVKYVEYSHKFHDGLLPGRHFAPKEELWENEHFKEKHPASAAAMERLLALQEESKKEAALKINRETHTPLALVPAVNQAPAGEAPKAEAPKAEAPKTESAKPAEAPKPAEAKATEPKAGEAAPAAPTGAAPAASAEKAPEPPAPGPGAPLAAGEPVPVKEAPKAAKSKVEQLPEDVRIAEAIRNLTHEEAEPLIKAGIIRSTADGRPLTIARPEHASVFFSIYFFMTGLHGVHVLIGIGIWVWMLVRSSRRRFGPRYFGPIDFSALYWHLVDLIWIYLFPMLYLIH